MSYSSKEIFGKCNEGCTCEWEKAGRGYLLKKRCKICESIQQEENKRNEHTYADKRALEYPSVGDQLDVIMKFADKLQEQSAIDIGDEARAWIEKCKSIKEKYPKS